MATQSHYAPKTGGRPPETRKILLSRLLHISVILTTYAFASCRDLTTPVTNVATVTIDPRSLTFRVGQRHQLNAIAKDAHNEILVGRSLTWSSSDTTTVTVSVSGMVTGIRPGEATITANSGASTGTATITVTAVPVITVEIDPPTVTLYVEQTFALAAVLKDSAGDTLTNRVVTWSSSDTARAIVTDSGVVKAVSAGSATITASSEGKTGTATIITRIIPVSTVDVEPGTVQLFTGETRQLSAVTRDSAGRTQIGRAVTWMSSDTTRATVTDSGVVTALREGVATITAICEGKAGTTVITIGRDIVYAAQGDGDGRVNRVFKVHPDGTLPTMLADSVSDMAWPVWSPDGSKIAFVGSSTITGRDIFVMNADGSGKKNLTNSPEPDDYPLWSPTGTHIAFASYRATGNYQIFVMESDGSNPRRVSPATRAAGFDRGMSWSPDGRSLAYYAVKLISYVPFEYEWEIMIATADGTGERVLLEHPGSEIHPSWSPDGQWLAITANWGGPNNVWLVSKDGLATQQLTDGSADVDFFSPNFSPDGSRIAFMRSVSVWVFRPELGDAVKASYHTVGIMMRDGSNKIFVDLGPGQHLHNSLGWSPDSKHIVFASDGDIWTANVITGIPSRITKTPLWEGEPFWK